MARATKDMRASGRSPPGGFKRDVPEQTEESDVPPPEVAMALESMRRMGGGGIVGGYLITRKGALHKLRDSNSDVAKSSKSAYTENVMDDAVKAIKAAADFYGLPVEDVRKALEEWAAQAARSPTTRATEQRHGGYLDPVVGYVPTYQDFTRALALIGHARREGQSVPSAMFLEDHWLAFVWTAPGDSKPRIGRALLTYDAQHANQVDADGLQWMYQQTAEEKRAIAQELFPSLSEAFPQFYDKPARPVPAVDYVSGAYEVVARASGLSVEDVKARLGKSDPLADPPPAAVRTRKNKKSEFDPAQLSDADAIKKARSIVNAHNYRTREYPDYRLAGADLERVRMAQRFLNQAMAPKSRHRARRASQPAVT